jgi:hypothetical protein
MKHLLRPLGQHSFHATPWLAKPGVLASLRFCFAFFGLDERYGDFATVENTIEQALCHPHANHPAATTAPKCSQVFPD